MPRANLNLPPKDDMGSKIVPWEKRHGGRQRPRPLGLAGVAFRVGPPEGPTRPKAHIEAIDESWLWLWR
jgi:hypothetical protein